MIDIYDSFAWRATSWSWGTQENLCPGAQLDGSQKPWQRKGVGAAGVLCDLGFHLLVGGQNNLLPVAKLLSCLPAPLSHSISLGMSFFFVQGPRILCGASWSAALSEYICSNHVLSPHLDILKGHNLKPYRTDGEANGKKETPSELELEFEFWVRVRHATCNAIQSGKKRNSLAERHPKVAEIELKDNTKCQRRQRRSSTQIADQASGQRIGTSQVVAKRGGAAITFHWAHSDNEPPTHTRKNNWVS